jgi:hypothetical protein
LLAHLDITNYGGVFCQKTIGANLGLETPTCFDKCHKNKGSKLTLFSDVLPDVTKKQSLRKKSVLISIHETHLSKQVV